MVGDTTGEASERHINDKGGLEKHPSDLYRFQQLSMDGPALLFILGIVLVTSLLSGLLLAWSLSKVGLAPGLKDDGVRSGPLGTSGTAPNLAW
jgi:hypothetical protein